MTDDPRLTEKFSAALAFAAETHALQLRKGGDIPYLGHLLSVTSLVIEAGGTEAQAIAALLHDAAEDQGGEQTLAAIRERFGEEVASIVAACSDTFETPKPPWRERKEAYLRHLAWAQPDVLLVSLADKLDNARAILRDFREHGAALWERFNVQDPEDHLWYYRSLLEVFQPRVQQWMVDELQRVVDELEQLVRGSATPSTEDPGAVPLPVLAPRNELVQDALVRAQAWLLSQEEEIKAEFAFTTPGDPDDDFEYAYSGAIDRVLDHTRRTIDALRAERDAIVDEQTRWSAGLLMRPDSDADSSQPPTRRSRFRGTFLGLAAGDALGTTIEFSTPGSFPPLTDIVGGGPFHLPAGAWTDDTSMAICLAESLIARRWHAPVDALGRWLRWYRHGYRASTGVCFDIGNATRQALERFEATREPFPGDSAKDAGGNGSLMRIAPLAMFQATRVADGVAMQDVINQVRTTHGMREAIDATRYFTALLIGALRGDGKEVLLGPGTYRADLWTDPMNLCPRVAEIAAGSFLHRNPPQIRGEGFAPLSLEAALWAVSRTDSYADAVLAAANLGDDADTTAAIAGQLAGALYGEEAIPEHWRELLVERDRIVALADALYDIAEGGDAGLPLPGDGFWVEAGRLAAGPYPGAPTKEEATAKLDEFLDAGITCFVDLTEEGEGRPPLYPYAQLLRNRAAIRGVDVRHIRLPIRDVQVPQPWIARAALHVIDEALAHDEVVYVHCWGGVGRTGTIVGCRLAGQGETDPLARLQELRAGTARAHRVAPETEEQRKFVTSWPRGATAGSLGELSARLRDEGVVNLYAHEGTQLTAAWTPACSTVELLATGFEVPEEPRLTAAGLTDAHPPRFSATFVDADAAAVAKAALRAAHELFGLTPSSQLRPAEIADPQGPYEAVVHFSMTFDGYAHFGEDWASDAERLRALAPNDHTDADDLRGLLFILHRADRFSWGEDTRLSEPDEYGVRHVENNPDVEATDERRYRRELVARLRQLVDSRT